MNKFPEIKCENEIALSVLTGSHNYNLNTENSDRDYKFFVYPTFDDLYYGKRYATSLQSEDVDYTVHDIRSLGELTFKANLNFLEVWYSGQCYTPDYFIQQLYSLRKSLVKMNLPGFFNATYGMHLEKYNALFKGTTTTKELIEKFGFDTKQACHSLRCLYVLERYQNTQDLGEAIYFENSDPQREVLLALKCGEVCLDEFYNLVTEWNETKKDSVKNFYYSFKPDLQCKEVLENTIKNLVEDKIGLYHKNRVILA